MSTTDTTDALGRVLTVKKMNALDRLKLFKACGNENANNNPYLGMAAIAASVVAIDGKPQPAVISERTIEAAVAALGDEGIEAAAKIMVPPESETAEQVIDAAKN